MSPLRRGGHEGASVRYLISGGTGFLGSALTTDLLADGHQVVVLSRSARPASRHGLSYLPWDGRSAGTWWREAGECEVWIHLAGENLASGRWTRGRKERFRASRLGSGAALVDAARRLGRAPRVFVQASAVGYYGSTGDRVVGESAPVGSGFLADLALQWEGSTVELEQLGSRRLILRTGVVLSADGGALPRLVLPFRLLAGGTLGSGRQWVPWIHERDQLRATRFLIDQDAARGAFNLVAPAPVTQRDLAEALGATLGRPALFRVPEMVLRLVLGEMAVVVVEGQRALPERLLRAGFRFQHTELREALSSLLRGRPGGGTR